MNKEKSPVDLRKVPKDVLKRIARVVLEDMRKSKPDTNSK